MALRTLQLALAATQKRLSDAYAGSTPGVANPATDIPYRQVTLQAEGAAVYVGSDILVSTTVYGNKIATDGSLTFGGGFDSGPLHLSDFYVLGASATVHVSGIPF